jgi:hypothetical protein
MADGTGVPAYQFNGWLYHDPGHTQPFTADEMQKVISGFNQFPSSGGGGGFPGGPGVQPPAGGNVPIFGNQDPFFGGTGGDSFGGDQSGGGQSFLNSDWFKLLAQLGLGLTADKFLGGRTSEEKSLREFSTAPFESGNIQQFLPPALREQITGPILLQAMRQIGELISRPGGLQPGVSEAILPRLAAESESIASNFRGIRANQEGALTRGNAPVSIKGALSSALDVAQERAQRGARREALTESEGLRREDVGQAYKLLDTLLQFTSSGRGQAIPGLSAAANLSGQRQASRLAGIGNLLSNLNFGSNRSDQGVSDTRPIVF